MVIKESKMIEQANDTAFWMAGCRAELPELSKDIYAKHWLNKASKKKHQEYTTQVSPTENIALSLRNRFFFEEISAYLAKNPNSVFINIGAGFSSYPFLMNENGSYFEADCAENINKKKKRIKELQDKNLLPKRNITFHSVNLNCLSEIEQLKKELLGYIGNRKSFILYEGLIYYLPAESTEKLFSLARDIQRPESYLGIVSWNIGTFDYPVYKRFRAFMTVSGQDVPKFTCHDSDFINKISGYKLVKQTGYIELSERFGMTKPLKSDDDVFWEQMTVLTKKYHG